MRGTVRVSGAAKTGNGIDVGYRHQPDVQRRPPADCHEGYRVEVKRDEQRCGANGPVETGHSVTNIRPSKAPFTRLSMSDSIRPSRRAPAVGLLCVSLSATLLAQSPWE